MNQQSYKHSKENHTLSIEAIKSITRAARAGGWNHRVMQTPDAIQRIIFTAEDGVEFSSTLETLLQSFGFIKI